MSNYSEQYKLSIVQRVFADGPKEDINKVAKDIGVHRSTIYRWKREMELAAKRQQEEEEAAKNMEIGMQMLLDDAKEFRRIKHFTGRYISGNEDEITIEDDCSFEFLTFSVTQDTVNLYDKKINIGERVHLLVKGHFAASYYIEIIADEKIYEAFAAVEDLKKKVTLMKSMKELSEPQKQLILQERMSGRYEVVETGGVAKFVTGDQLRIKFSLTRTSYTAQQQMDIEALLKEVEAKNGNRGKTIEKLRPLLNISTINKNRKQIKSAAIERAIKKEVYGHEKQIKTISDFISTRNDMEEKGCQILIVGNQNGCFGKPVADILGIPYGVVQMASSATNHLMGLDSSYQDSEPGLIVKEVYQNGTSDQVLILDNLDQIGEDKVEGSPWPDIVNMFSKKECYDRFLESYIQVQNCVFVATAKTTKTIPQYVLDCFDLIVYLDDLTKQEKFSAAKEFVLPRLYCEYGINGRNIKFHDEALRTISNQYCCDGGLDKLRKNLQLIIQKIKEELKAHQEDCLIIVDKQMAISILDKYYDEADLATKYYRNKEKYSETVQQEIKDLLALIESPISNKEKEEYRTKASYLINIVPNHDPDTFDRVKFRRIVNKSHHGMESIKNEIENMFYARSRKRKTADKIFYILVGPPGVGKSSIVFKLAEALGKKATLIPMNGAMDPRVVKGTKFVEPGRIIKGIAAAGTTNTIVVFDEIEKCAECVSKALVDVLDSSHGYIADDYIGVPIEANGVVYFATANNLQDIDPVLRDRAIVIKVGGYSSTEKDMIIQYHIIPEIEDSFGSLSIEIEEEARTFLIEKYFMNPGVREIKQSLDKIVEDKITTINLEKVKVIKIDKDDVIRIIGSPPIQRGNYPAKPCAGVARALAVNGEYSGMSFAVQTSILSSRDKEKIVITGMPEQSTKDSISLARTFIETQYGLKCDEFHIHFAEGAVPKDGPSAGVAILISLLSARTNIPVSGDIAYTGELDLHGNIWAVGGIKEKIQAAKRDGCKEVFIPMQNYRQMTMKEIKQFDNITVSPVEHIDEVVAPIFGDTIGDYKASCDLKNKFDMVKVSY